MFQMFKAYYLDAGIEHTNSILPGCWHWTYKLHTSLTKLGIKSKKFIKNKYVFRGTRTFLFYFSNSKNCMKNLYLSWDLISMGRHSLCRLPGGSLNPSSPQHRMSVWSTPLTVGVCVMSWSTNCPHYNRFNE